jgi:hypothetical protein
VFDVVVKPVHRRSECSWRRAQSATPGLLFHPVGLFDRFSVLGCVPAGGTLGPGSGFMCAADVLLLGDRRAVFGFRTTDYVQRLLAGHEAEAWPGGYVPLQIDRAVLEGMSHWDFNTLLWLGPRGHPCVVWSNAVGISVEGIGNLLTPLGTGNLFSGPEGRGLPSPEDLGIEIPPALPVHGVPLSNPRSQAPSIR